MSNEYDKPAYFKKGKPKKREEKLSFSVTDRPIRDIATARWLIGGREREEGEILTAEKGLFERQQHSVGGGKREMASGRKMGFKRFLPFLSCKGEGGGGRAFKNTLSLFSW